MSKKGRIFLAFLLATLILMAIGTSEEMARRRYNQSLAAQEGTRR